MSRLGYAVESAREGAEALALYRRAKEQGTPFDVVIMDLVIVDGMDGKEAIDKLRKNIFPGKSHCIEWLLQ